jgi:hypothetical protein
MDDKRMIASSEDLFVMRSTLCQADGRQFCRAVPARAIAPPRGAGYTRDHS